MAEYERRCAEMLETATDNAKAAMPPAIDRLRGIIDDDQQQPQQHIAAARAVLEYGLRLVEANDFEQRLRAGRKEQEMKRDFTARLKALEDSLTTQDPVAIVEPVPGGYLLKTGEQKGAIVTMDDLNKRYDVVIVDDVPRIKESE